MAVGWDDDPVVAAWPGLAPLAGDATADACVVGLGASGLAAVAAFADRGLSVIGVDAGRVAGAAAGRNGGFLCGGPAVALHEAIAAWGVDPTLWLYTETLAELATLEAELGPDVVHHTGSIRLAGLPGDPQSEAEERALAAELADCALEAAAMRTHGLAVEEYEGPLGRGLFLPSDAATNPARRAIELARRLTGRAALHEHTRVHSVAAGRVVTALGTVNAGLVVVAVDGKLDLLVPQLRERVHSARLQMLATSPLEAVRLPCPVCGRSGYDYGQQDAGGRLYVGGGRDLFEGDEWTAESTPTAPVQAYLETLGARFAGRPVGVTHRWAASVGFTADGRALCAPVDDGVVACGGYSGTGNLVGPVAARAAAGLLLDGVTPPGCFSATPAS